MAPKRSASHRLILPCVLIWLFHFEATFSILEGIQKAAQAQRISPEKFLENVSGNAGAYQESNKIAGRVDFMNSLKEAMRTKGLHLVISGGSLGTTKILKTMVDQAGDAALLYVDMRLPPVPSSGDVLQCLQAEAKRRWNAKNVPSWFPDAMSVLGAVSAGAAQAVSALLNIKSPEDFVTAFGDAAVAGGQVPVIMIDEANLAFPTHGENGSENAAKREAASKALATLVALTKKVSVILIASDYAFSLGLQGLRFNKYGSLKSIVCPEVEEEPMLEVLKEWGLSQDLAKEFYKNFGGNIFLCHQAIDKLQEQFRMGEENLFHPFNVRGGNACGDLVGDPLTRKHMVNLAEKGWSAIEDGTATEETESQRGARVIAKRNFGAIIEREAPTFLDPALKAAMFRDPNVGRVLLSPTTYARKCIQRMVETMKSSRPQQAGAVWVRQLQQDGKDFEIVGNAFQVKGVLTNVNDLKTAIKKKQEKPNRVMCDADEIDLYSQKDGRWVKEEKMSASLRETDKADCYGFVLPAVPISA
ncbi:unnamed protein product [Effrenium voratum]|uniref:Uncharacterized protein n=2 Tax=Effrenium voratum TaxID=2562239 RepID=A0AA36JGG1_9DINO|nr:unnamed protein product [Effrenium voratum]